MTARIWIDVEDLFIYYAAAGHRPSGIQRLEFELCRALVGLLPDRISFVRHAREQRLRTIPWEDVEALVDDMSNREAKVGEDAPPVPIRRRHSIKKTLASLVPRRIRKLARRRLALQAALPAADSLPAEDFAAQPGDILAIFGSPWISADYHSYGRKAIQENGLHLALLIYDIIPLRRPNWFSEVTSSDFRTWFENALQLADIVLTISAATAADVSSYARKAGLALRAVPTPIPIGTGFTTGRQNFGAFRSMRLPPPHTYALFVSTIEVRKNHAMLFRVWQLMLDDMPSGSVPTLVFAGRVGWLVSDLMQQLRNSNFLDGKIVHIESPTDEELEALYDGCLFTLYPSFYEGWGLPVTESHAFGRPCITSKTTSLPEAGGSLARYIDPDNATEAYRVIRETIEDQAALSKWRDRVRHEFKPVEWSESARAVLKLLEKDRSSLKGS